MCLLDQHPRLAYRAMFLKQNARVSAESLIVSMVHTAELLL